MKLKAIFLGLIPLFGELSALSFCRAPYVNPCMLSQLAYEGHVLAIEVELGQTLSPSEAFYGRQLDGCIDGCSIDYNSGDGRSRDPWERYRYLGKSDGGVYVVEWEESGGGTGIFSSLLLLKFEWQDILSDGEPKKTLVLQKVGQIHLGDRHDRQILVRGNALFTGEDYGFYGNRESGSFNESGADWGDPEKGEWIDLTPFGSSPVQPLPFEGAGLEGALAQVSVYNCYEECVYLIDKGMAVDRPDTKGQTPLIAAAAQGWPAPFCHLLLEKGASINARDDEGVTPLLAACRHFCSCRDTAFLLLESGAEVNCVDRSRHTPLFEAVSHEGMDLPKALIERGAKLAIKTLDNRMTPLTHALACYQTECAHYLLDCGAPLEANDPYALPFAAASGFLRGVEQLIEKGVDPNQKSWLDRTPLIEALSRGHLKTARYLLDHGAHVGRDSEGALALHAAIPYADPPLIEALIEKGADVSVLDAEGETPLHCAARKGDIRQFMILLERGANPRLEGEGCCKWTPLELAASRFDPETLSYIKECFPERVDGPGTVAEVSLKEESLPGECEDPTLQETILN